MINNIINFIAGVIVGYSICLIMNRIITENKEDKNILDKDIDIINKLIKVYIREIQIKESHIIAKLVIANNSMLNVEIRDIELKANDNMILKLDPSESNYIYPYIDKTLLLSSGANDDNIINELTGIEIKIKAKTRYHDLSFYICEDKYKNSKIKIDMV